MDTIFFIGAIGTIVCTHLHVPNATVYNIFMILLAVGLLGTSLFRWTEQRAKNKGKGKRAVSIASTAYLVFIAIICIWTILGKLGIL